MIELKPRSAGASAIIADGQQQLARLLSEAIGCIDADRCNDRIKPYGSCKDCVENAYRALVELRASGYELRHVQAVVPVAKKEGVQA